MDANNIKFGDNEVLEISLSDPGVNSTTEVKDTSFSESHIIPAILKNKSVDENEHDNHNENTGANDSEELLAKNDASLADSDDAANENQPASGKKSKNKQGSKIGTKGAAQEADNETSNEEYDSITIDAFIDEREQEILELKEKNNELTTLCKRLQADFDNYRKRNNENLKSIRTGAIVEVIEKFLPTLDVIDNAVAMIKDEQVAGGIKMMRRQLMDVFGAYDVKEIDALGQDFNPSFHEAVVLEEDADKSGKVLEVMRKGYLMGERVLRYAAVKVAK